MKGSPADAKACALKFLSYRSRSRNEIIDKLRKKGYAPQSIDSAVQYLELSGYINDKDLAAEIVRYASEIRPLGKKGIELMLAKRGIGKDLVQAALEEYSAETEERSAVKLAKKKLRIMGDCPEDVKRRRLWGMLQRRGFSPSVISRIIESVTR